MSKHRTPPRVDVQNATKVSVGERFYYVFLKSETVFTEVIGRNGKAFMRRVTSRDIETSAILRASDAAHA
jgi:hypothetical protein